MDEPYIIANFNTLCRLCLNKSTLMISIFEETGEDPLNSLPKKIANCSEIEIKPKDGLPSKICYKCLYKLDKCAKFKQQCVQSEYRLKQIFINFNKGHHSNLPEINSKNHQDVDSVVMVVDPSLDYDSSGESDNGENTTQDVTETEPNPEGEPMQESFYRNVAMCQYCDQAFVTDELCAEHEQNQHDPKLPYSCVECSLVFSERPQYIQHSKLVHGNDKPYQCTQCNKGFGRRSDLRKHSIVHTGIRPYQCNYCMKNFSRNTNLSKHLRIHAGQKPNICPYCPRSFIAKGDLERHVLIHSGMKPFTCSKCPLSFARRDKLIKHELASHETTSLQSNMTENGVETNMVVNVNPFSNFASSSNDLSYELPRVPEHITGETSFLNNQVQSNRFKPMQSPKKTKPMSNKKKPKIIKCHQCPKRFSSLDAYKTHVSMAHIGLRGFQCKICFKKFARKRDLDCHIPMHSGMKPFSCGQCEKTFTRKDKLVNHESMHESSVVDMPCIECGDVFQKKAELVAHIKSHFSEDFEERCRENDINEKTELELNHSFYSFEA